MASASENKIFDDIQPKLKLIPGFQKTVLEAGGIFAVYVLAPISKETRQQIQQIFDEHIPPSPYSGRIEEIK